jgi:exodeoxyribonuclease VII large subunit
MGMLDPDNPQSAIRNPQFPMSRRKLRYTFDPPAAPAGGGTANEPVLSVDQLTRGIRRILESSFEQVSVRGEISGLSCPRSGHLYFSLRDGGGTSGSQISVVLFRDQALNLRFRLEDGQQVVVRGRLTVYEPRGAYQIVARNVAPDGPGEIALALERLKQRLAGEGLFAEARKRPLPFLPRRIGVATSPSGAAVHDILRAIYRRHPAAWVRIVPVRVQGEGASAEIAAALELLGRPEAEVEVVIVGRGGGSPEDLWAFNEERVVRAVAGCRVPVISAVGHEVDFTLCDLAADVRAQTPTHAGEMVVPDIGDLRREMAILAGRLGRGLQGRVVRLRERLDRVEHAWPSLGTRAIIEARSQRLDDLARVLQKSLYNTYRRWHDKLRVFSGNLNALNPLAVLQRGFSVVFDSRGKAIRRAADLRRGEPLRILFHEGTARAVVEKIEADGAQENVRPNQSERPEQPGK